MNPLTQSKKTTTTLPVLIAVALISFWLAPTVQATCMDGCSGLNTFLGESALANNTTGDYNTAIGFQALYSNTTGNQNTAIGVVALYSNTEGFNNTATGVGALGSNTTGYFNTAIGFDALDSNTTGSSNTAIGINALNINNTGGDNTATGTGALLSNTTGNENTATGIGALTSNTTGSNNIGVGAGAGSNVTTGSNNIDIGNVGVGAEANTIRIGTQGVQMATFIAGISGAGVTGMAVKVNAAGQVGTAPSSVRFKQNIKSMGDTSDEVYRLRPVTFRYKKELDAEGIRQFGLVAEDVEKVNPDLVDRDRDGKPYTVRYEAVNAMLLNEFLKEHRKNEEQEKTIAELKSGMTALIATVKEQAAQIQKVTAQIEVTKPASQVVDNTP
jgi:hypothetical protein